MDAKEAVAVNGNGNVYRIYDESETMKLADGERVPWQILVQTYLVNDEGGTYGAKGTRYSWEASIEELTRVGCFVQKAIDERREARAVDAAAFLAGLTSGRGALARAVSGHLGSMKVREVDDADELYRLATRANKEDLRHPEGKKQDFSRKRGAGVGSNKALPSEEKERARWV